MSLESIKLSARRLAEYVHRGGSIDARFASSTALIEGTRIHQEVQKKYGERDEKEVHVEQEIDVDGTLFRLEGRCDGVLVRNGSLIIDEIKSTSRQLEEITEPSEVHVAQAIVYAWIIAEERKLDEIAIQVTYVQTNSKEEKRFLTTFSIEKLQEKVVEMVRRYAPFAKLIIRRRQET